MTKDTFFSILKAAESGCMEWTRKTLPPPGFPYGRLRVNGKDILAHRYAYQLCHGEIPVGMCVLHRCDNPKCCNPAHLFLGTQLDNVKDRDAKGRCGAKGQRILGERSGSTKLSNQDVLDIRRASAERGETTISIGARYGLHPSCVSRIITRKTWAHI